MKQPLTFFFRAGRVLPVVLALGVSQVGAQVISASNSLVAQPIPDRTIPYGVSAPGVAKPIIWGLDLAWLSETNIRRGVAFMGADRVDVVRSSFTPTSPLVNGDLASAELATLNSRLSIINTWLGSNTQVVLNCDHPSVSSWFKDANGVGIASRWAQLLDVTTRRHQEAGRTVVTISPFNEPDYTATGQGTISDFFNIAGELRTNPRFNNIRISGGNTLNTDAALTWYNPLKSRLDEGNTHQLAGSFDNFANFYQTVRADGKHATGDEMHNVMEAMVGSEYGMQTGIWWGTAELARGELVKATDGVRIGYGEHRPNFTSGAVYRNLDGKVQVFGGTSERQAITTTYRFVSKERDVYYDGYGPQREYTMVLPGGIGYSNGQTGAERVLNVTWGDDIQPVINGRYMLVNRASGKVLQVEGGSTADGAKVQQATYAGATSQQWDVTPVSSQVGGDFSYFSVTAAHSGKSLDDFNFSLDNGTPIAQWVDLKGVNQQRYLDYAADGWFRIRSRHSAKCVDVASDGLSIVQQDKNTNSLSQQWRMLPVGAPIEFVAPSAPGSLVATASPESVRLNWTASPESDVAGYTIFRAESASGPYNTIARKVTTTAFVDNTTTTNGQYFYKIKAIDNSLNSSAYSAQVAATTTGTPDLVTQLSFDGNTLDNSVNLNHAATYGGTSYVAGKVGANAIALNGTNAFVQLPATVANQAEITVATWVYCNGGAAWQRIFDFGNDQTQYMFLTPNTGAGTLRFGIRNGGAEQVLDAPALPTGTWSHVAVTLGAAGARLFVNGVQVAASSAVTIRPLDFKPVLNYLGRSQFSDALLNGRLDDFKVYNYEMAPIEVANLGSAVVYYQVRNRATAMYLDGVARTTNGANVSQYANTGSFNSLWDLVEVGNGYYHVQNRATGLFLDGMGRTVNGDICGQYANTNNPNSHWSVKQFDGVFYRIQNRTTGLYLDGAGRTTNGADATQYANTTSPNAQWEFVTTAATRLAATLAAAPAEDAKTVLFYPNPVTDVLHIRLKDGEQAAEARIYNVAGQLLRSTSLTAPDSKVKVGELATGLYLIEVTTKSETTRSRFVKE
jgi:hypothetical protein